MIRVNDEWEIICDYHDCIYCDSGMCYAGIYQCPYITERASACLKEAIKDYEDFKLQVPYGDEYYEDLARLEHQVSKYRKILNKGD